LYGEGVGNWTRIKVFGKNVSIAPMQNLPDLAGRKIEETGNWIEARMGSSEWGAERGQKKITRVGDKGHRKEFIIR